MPHDTRATSDAAAAARLIAASTGGKVGDDEAAALLRRYVDDPAWRIMVEAQLDALGLRVLDTTRQRLVVAPTDGSPFAMRVADHPSVSSTDEKNLLGLTMIGVCAYAYPMTGETGTTDPMSLSPQRVMRDITDTCQELERLHPDDSPVDSEALRQGWRRWLSLPDTKHTKKSGRLSRAASRMWFVEEACNWLEQQGLLVGTRDDDDNPIWLTTREFRVHVDDAAHSLRAAIPLNLLRAELGRVQARQEESTNAAV